MHQASRYQQQVQAGVNFILQLHPLSMKIHSKSGSSSRQMCSFPCCYSSGARCLLTCQKCPLQRACGQQGSSSSGPLCGLLRPYCTTYL
jgi:hypothetical protein